MFKNNIKYLRLKNGFTQFELHTKTGLSRQFLCDIENGKRKISLASRIKIADALGIEMSEIKML